MADLDDRMDEVAQEPAEASGDQGSFKNQPIPDLIALDLHRQAKAAGKKKNRGILFQKIVPPGAS